MTECPTGCGRRVAVGKLLCGPCWSEVPGHLQADVMRTWRALAATLLPAAQSLAALRTARLAYQSARDAAIGSIR